MDRQAKKLEKKRKNRALAKKKAKVALARRPGEAEQYARLAGRHPFGPCFVSATYDDLKSPAIVSLIVTRALPDGRLLPATALVDRTCLGIKNGFALPPMYANALADLVEKLGTPHGGMVDCDPLTAQSVAFHAIDYAHALGFEPHGDFPSAHFGPRPATLANTPWSSPDKPIYMSGPHDDERAIRRRLTEAVGARGFEVFDPFALCDDFGDDEATDDVPLVFSSLGRTVSGEGVTAQVLIYRGPTDSGWVLEVEDDRGGSTVWDEQFATEHAALDAAMQAIEEDGVASFTASASSA